MNRKRNALQRRIGRIKEQIAALGDLRPGSLSQQYNVCGTPRCRCKAADRPQKHGPYYQVGWTRKGRSTTRFVRASDLREVRQQLRNYERLQALVELWVDLSIEACELKMKQSRCD